MELPFNERGVSVTRNALSVAGQVIALRDVQDLRVVTIGRDRKVPIGLAVAGVIGLAVWGWSGSSAALVCGLMMMGVGLLTWYSQDVTHQLIVVTGGEDREALSSTDRAFVERVEQVMRQAMGGRSDSATAA